MKFDEKKFRLDILDKYVTEYGAEICEVYCQITERDKLKNDFENFINNIKDNSFFDKEKINRDSLKVIKFNFAIRALTSSIIKEPAYGEHFMTWEEGLNFTHLFIEQLGDIETVYTNSFWENAMPFEKPISTKELSLRGSNNCSLSEWYDYGFVFISDNKIGVIWFGDSD